MKSYSQVYNRSKAEVLARRKAVFDSQKEALVNVLKENYMITGKISDLPKEQKQKMALKLAEYWSPKTGINAAGIRLLNEDVITLSKNSTPDDVKLFVVKQTKKNLQQITESFRMGRADAVVETFRDEIAKSVGRKPKEKFILDTVWGIVGSRIKNGI